MIGGSDTVIGFKALGLDTFPGRDGSKGLGLQALKDAVEKAVGSDITGD